MSKESGSFGNVFKGLSELVDRLSDLSDKASELSNNGEFSDEKRGIRGVYGFSVKMGLGESGGMTVEPFGNVRRDQTTNETTVSEVREPLVDVFEEDDHMSVIAEMPGVGPGDIKLDVDGDILSISAAMPDRKYRKEVLLPRSVSTDQREISCNNGIVAIKLR
ncbi:MAG: Hsp20/alpha crystallin family protein [Proteobacteria bacterium]|nr:Hsp20/alpha crystallin family protein [Pseudomonadota bacterium]